MNDLMMGVLNCKTVQLSDKDRIAMLVLNAKQKHVNHTVRDGYLVIKAGRPTKTTTEVTYMIPLNLVDEADMGVLYPRAG